jgi:hypothetical protein
MNVRRALAHVIVVALALPLVAACSSSGPSASAKQAFVEAQASALCAVRNHKFSDEAAQLAAYAGAIDHARLTNADLAALKKDVEHDRDLRAAITARVTESCG